MQVNDTIKCNTFKKKEDSYQILCEKESRTRGSPFFVYLYKIDLYSYPFAVLVEGVVDRTCLYVDDV